MVLQEKTKWFVVNAVSMAFIQFFVTLSVQALCMGGQVEVKMNVLASTISGIVVFLIQVKAYSEKRMTKTTPCPPAGDSSRSTDQKQLTESDIPKLTENQDPPAETKQCTPKALSLFPW